MNLISQRYGEDVAMNVRAGTQNLRSAALLAGVRELADIVAADDGLRRLIEDSPREVVLDKLRSDAPAFAAKFDRLVADCGHRGPGETELSNLVYADAPELLLRSVMGSIRTGHAAPAVSVQTPVGRALVRARRRRHRATRTRARRVHAHHLRAPTRAAGMGPAPGRARDAGVRG